jgi:hypothetical protein
MLVEEHDEALRVTVEHDAATPLAVLHDGVDGDGRCAGRRVGAIVLPTQITVPTTTIEVITEIAQ